MLESRVIKRCYPRFSVPSHLYARNAYDFFAFLRLFLCWSAVLTLPRSIIPEAGPRRIDGPGAIVLRAAGKRKRTDAGSP